MTDDFASDPQLPPTTAMQNISLKNSQGWFEYIVQVYPHHTDYAGIVWHGTYIAWFEEARIECLRSIGVNYADLVAQGCELPVIELSIRYHRFIKMGNTVIVKTRMTEIDGLRFHWDCEICSLDHQELYVTGRVTLVAVDPNQGKLLRRLPAGVKETLAKLVV